MSKNVCDDDKKALKYKLIYKENGLVCETDLILYSINANAQQEIPDLINLFEEKFNGSF